ncbi:unnamed protein product [Pedinophyceae sp. YPF-701]|nr:unnamed protein product [Pedinophyceae sp. YPF-701]
MSKQGSPRGIAGPPRFSEILYSPREPTLAGRAVAAAGASLVAGLVVNPLDVIKTRMQAQQLLLAGILSEPAPRHTLYDRWGISSCAATCFRKPSKLGRVKAPHTCTVEACDIYHSSADLVRKVWQREGLRAFWRGTPESLLMAVPLVGIYMPLYESTLVHMQRWLHEDRPGPFLPLVAGTMSRAVSVLSVGPLELLRTQAQATASSEARRCSTTAIKQGWSSAGMRGVARAVAPLWRGAGATLIRDVPYSGLYWMGVEAIRGRVHSLRAGQVDGPLGKALARRPEAHAGEEQRDAVLINMVAGAVSGSAAAAVTTPLDVVKTYMQTSTLISSSAEPTAAPAPSTARAPAAAGSQGLAAHGVNLGNALHARNAYSGGLSMGVERGMSSEAGAGAGAGNGWTASIRSIYRSGGISGFFTGWAPRSARAAPACAIVLGSYEAIKAYLSEL